MGSKDLKDTLILIPHLNVEESEPTIVKGLSQGRISNWWQNCGLEFKIVLPFPVIIKVCSLVGFFFSCRSILLSKKCIITCTFVLIGFF